VKQGKEQAVKSEEIQSTAHGKYKIFALGSVSIFGEGWFISSSVCQSLILAGRISKNRCKKILLYLSLNVHKHLIYML